MYKETVKLSSQMRLFFLLFAACLLMGAGADAAEYDGYLVKLVPSAELLSGDAPALPELHTVCAAEGVYQADSIDEVVQLREAGVLARAEPNYLVTLDDIPVLDSSPQSSQWYHAALGMDTVQERNVTGRGVRVGVVDSGIYAEHTDFSGTRILDGGNYCYAKSDSRHSDVSDEVGHGSFVSGVIAASGSGGSPNQQDSGGADSASAGASQSVKGLAPDVELVPLKCFTAKTGSLAHIIAAVYGGVNDWHCDILNLSFGIETQSSTFHDAIQYASAAGVLMTGAVGNLTADTHSGDTDYADPLKYPAAYPEVIGVGAVDKNENICWFSYRNESVWLTAPGSTIYGITTASATSRTAYGSGTSYATPMVTAAAALALSARPDLSPDEIRDMLRYTAWDLGEQGYDTAYGYGVLHIGRLIAAAAGDIHGQIAVVRSRLAGLYGGAWTMWTASYDQRGALVSCGPVSLSAPVGELLDAAETPSSETQTDPETDDAQTDPGTDDAQTAPGKNDEVTDPETDEGAAESPDTGQAVSWKLFILDSNTLVPLRSASTLYGGPLPNEALP